MPAGTRDDEPSRGAEREQPVPLGPRSELLAILGWLAADLLATPFHLLVFLFRRRHHRERLRRALAASAAAPKSGEP